MKIKELKLNTRMSFKMTHEAERTLLELREKLDSTVDQINRNFSKLLETLKITETPCISLGFESDKSKVHKECDLELKIHNVIRLFYDLLDIVTTLRDTLISFRLAETVPHIKVDSDNQLKTIKDMYDETLNRAERLAVLLLQQKNL